MYVNVDIESGHKKADMGYGKKGIHKREGKLVFQIQKHAPEKHQPYCIVLLLCFRTVMTEG